MRFILILISVIYLSHFTGFEAAAEVPAQWSTSRYAADIRFVDTGHWQAEKWYIGECSGDIAPRHERIKLYEEYNKGSDVIEVRLVSKYRADRIYCIK